MMTKQYRLALLNDKFKVLSVTGEEISASSSCREALEQASKKIGWRPGEKELAAQNIFGWAEKFLQ